LQQILTVWNALDVKRRVIVALSVLSAFVAIMFMAKIASTPSMALLYSGLDPAISGQVVAALEQSGTKYRVKGTSIFVDASRRDLMRMSLAEQGLPPSKTAGYELLDGLSGFGTTAQMFDVTYWRAKEGELARTILAWPQVRSARVHIANPVSRPFSKPVKRVASVTVKMSGGGLSPSRAQALRFLVASAVSGLDPKNVSIIDADRGLIPLNDPGSGFGFGNTRAAFMRNNIERLLAARVGPGNAVVEVSVDASLQSETVVQHSFDPKSRVAISTETVETSGSSSGQDAGGVTVASNLPSGSGAQTGGASKSSNSNTRERVNYEVSETTRKIETRPGMVNRLSVAVLINGTIDPATGAWSARSKEELASLQDLVQSAVGFNAKRGDVVTLKSMEFPSLPKAGTTATAAWFSGIIASAPVILQSSILAIVVLVLGLFVVRPALTSNPTRLLPSPGRDENPLGPEMAIEGAQLAIEAPGNAAVSSDPVTQLREIISGRQDEAVEVLRNWIETSDGQA